MQRPKFLDAALVALGVIAITAGVFARQAPAGGATPKAAGAQECRIAHY